MRTIYFALGIAMVLCFGLPIFGQTFGEITGEVRDSQGAVIPGAEVSGTDVAQNVSRTTTTNDAGLYAFPALPPGTYNLRVAKTDFKSATRTNVELQGQQSARVDVEPVEGQIS